MGLNFPVSPFSNGQRSVTHREVGPPNLLQISAKYDTFFYKKLEVCQLFSRKLVKVYLIFGPKRPILAFRGILGGSIIKAKLYKMST